MAYAFGDSYGGVAQNELALDAARDSRYFQSLADQRSRDRAAQDYNLAQQQLAQQHATSQAQLAQAFAEHRDAVNYQQQALNQAAQEADANRQNELNITNLRVAPYANKLDARTQANIYNQAWVGINNGSIRTPQDLATFSNALTPDDINRLMPALNEAHNRLLTAFGNQQAQAGRFNSDFNTQVGPTVGPYNTAEQQISAAPATSAQQSWPAYAASFIPLLGRNFQTQADYAKNPPPAVSQYKNALMNFEQGLQKNRAASSLNFDPTNPHQPFSPTMETPPSWNSQPSGILPPMATPPTTGASDGWVPVKDAAGHTYEVDPMEFQRMSETVKSQLASLSPTDPNYAVTGKVAAQKALNAAIAAQKARPAIRMPAGVIPPLSDDNVAPDASSLPDTGGLNLASSPDEDV